jgi:hypothetical protein
VDDSRPGADQEVQGGKLSQRERPKAETEALRAKPPGAGNTLTRETGWTKGTAQNLAEKILPERRICSFSTDARRRNGFARNLRRITPPVSYATHSAETRCALRASFLLFQPILPVEDPPRRLTPANSLHHRPGLSDAIEAPLIAASCFKRPAKTQSRTIPNLGSFSCPYAARSHPSVGNWTQESSLAPRDR